ncbi:MAG: hypothetical protein HY292_03915 [Planctomycetes bacterium]|nr:hypothetical protein [Planctomycetota bacterium]
MVSKRTMGFSGRLSVFGFTILWAVPVFAQVPQHSPQPKAPVADEINYRVIGGLLAVDNVLSIDGTGHATANLSNAASGNRVIECQLRAREYALVQSLFKAADFDAMPSRFYPDGTILDGVTLSITWQHDNLAHTVWSETAASEAVGFTLIREQLDGIIRDMLDTVVVTAKSEGGFIGARSVLTVKASGEWSYRSEIPGSGRPPVEAGGTLPAQQLARLSHAAEDDGFMSIATCDNAAGQADLIRYEVTIALNGEAHTVHFTDANAGEFAVFAMVQSAIAQLSQRVGR